MVDSNGAETSEMTPNLRVRVHSVLGDLPEAPEVSIMIDGREISAREGETIAAVMLAHGVRVFRTTPHSGQVRGPFCAIGRCPDCMMTVDGVPNVRTCVTVVQPGMRIETQQGLGVWKVDEV